MLVAISGLVPVVPRLLGMVAIIPKAFVWVALLLAIARQLKFGKSAFFKNTMPIKN